MTGTGLGSDDGYTTVLMRTDAGQEIYQSALRHRYVEEQVYDSYREKLIVITKIIDFVKEKRAREQ